MFSDGVKVIIFTCAYLMSDQNQSDKDAHMLRYEYSIF